jgi:hypothetical protein
MGHLGAWGGVLLCAVVFSAPSPLGRRLFPEVSPAAQLSR